SETARCSTVHRLEPVAARCLGHLPAGAGVGYAMACAPPPWSQKRQSFPRGGPPSQVLFLCPDLGRQIFSEILHLEHLANFDVGIRKHRIWAAFHPLDGFLDRMDLPEPEAGDELLGFGERAVREPALAGGKAQTRAGAGV